MEKRRTLKWLWAVAAVLLILVLAVAVAVALSAKQFHDSGMIAPGVSIEGVDVGGMEASEASRAVMSQWASRLPAEITLKWPGGEERVSPEKLGARLHIDSAVTKAKRVGREGGLITQVRTRMKLSRSGLDIPVETSVDEDAIEAHLIGLTTKVDRKPRNADISVVGARVDVIPGETGLHLEVADSIQRLAEALRDPRTDSFDLTVKVQHPNIRAEDLQHLEVVLASYTTRFKPSQRDRTENLRLAIGNLSRTVLMPGDTLSFNQRVGPRLIERGFREAPIFVDGEIEPARGGGVCQVASTVYNAALLANLDIRERRRHSRPVDYVPAGRDATVYWGQVDLKIRNNLSRPILILGAIGSDSMTVRILGSRADKYDVEIARSGLRTIPYETKEVPDPELEEGKQKTEKPGRNGVQVTVSRVVKRDGTVVRSQRLHTDTYPSQTRILHVGTKPPEPEEAEEAVPVAAPTGPADTPPVVEPPPAPRPAPAAPPVETEPEAEQ